MRAPRLPRQERSAWSALGHTVCHRRRVPVPARVTIPQPRALPPREPCPPAGPRADRDAGELRLLPVRAVPVRPGTPRAGRRDLSRRPALGVTLLSAAACSLLVVGALDRLLR